nr:hypothetical protein Itr_chr09CG19530 [Ipomoea trifida]
MSNTAMEIMPSLLVSKILGPEPTMLYNEGWYEAWIMMADFRNAEKPLNLVEAHG